MFDKLVDLFVSSIRFFQFCCVVRDYEGGVILRFGRYHRPAKPGFRWIWPLKVEEVLTTNVVPETMNVGPQSLTTKDGVSVVVSTVVTFSVEDPRTFLLGIEGANHVIEDCTYGAVSSYIMEHEWSHLVKVDLANELTKTMRRQAKKYGVAIQNVQIGDFTKSRSLRLMQQWSNKFEPVRYV